MADLEFVADFTDLQLMRRELVGVAKDAKQSAGVFEREYNKVERQITRTAKANQQHYNELLKVDRASKSAANSADVFNRELGKQEANVERLKNKYVPLYAASKQYERSLDERKAAHQQGILTAAQYDTALENLNAQFNMMNTHAVGNTRSMNAMGMAIQQTGYQVGDFLVQVQGGTNWMVAFGQQATQLVGVLPMMAEQFNMNVNRLIGIASVAGIVIPLVTAIGAAFMRTRDAAGGMSDVTSEVESATSALKELNREVNNFNQGITSSFDEMLAGLELNIELARKAIEDMQKSNPLLTLPGAGIRMGNRVEELRAAEEALRLAKELVAERQRQREAEKMAADERLLGEQMLQAAREESLRIYEEEQKAIKETEDYILAMEKVFKDAQRRMREEEITATETALTRLFRNRTVMYSIRFSGEETVMSQPVIQPPKGPAPPSYKEAVRLGLTEDQMKILGVDIPRGGSSGSSSKGGSKNPIEQAEEYLQKIQREAEFKSTLIGLSDEQVAQDTRREQLLNQLNGYEEGLGNQYSERIEQIIQMEAETRKLMEAEQQREQMLQTVESNVATFVDSLVDGTKSIEDAFKGMLRNILMEVWKQSVSQPIAEGVGSFVKSLFFADGAAFSGGKVTAFANGGVVGSPTMFPMKNGMGLMGEAGPEAIMPLKRGKNGKLGIQMEGSSVSSVVVQNHFHIAANGDESVRRIVAAEAPRIANLTQKQIMDQRRRGGSMKTTFG